MANLTESSTWEPGIYRLELSDPVQGGAGGTSNCQPLQLANRTTKIYDTLKTRGVFINLAEEAFVGQPSFMNATFEGTVVDEDVVYYNISNSRFEKAQADGTIKQYAIGIADVTNSRVVSSGLIDTSRSDTNGDIIYLSATVAGAMTLTPTDITLGQYLYSGIIYLAPAAAATAASASIAPGSITPGMLQECYYPRACIDAKCSNWDTAHSDRLKWDGGALDLNPATGRTSLELDGDVTTHCHDTQYYTITTIDTKCSNWDTAYTERNQWDGGATGLVAATGRTSLGLDGTSNTTHYHDSRYYTESEINAKCGNWDTAYNERLRWSGTATGLNASTARTSLGLTGTSNTTHYHDSRYYTESESVSLFVQKNVSAQTITGQLCVNKSSGTTKCAVVGFAGTTLGCAGVYGCAYRYGVCGRACTCFGVFGYAVTCHGVYGCTNNRYGAYGQSLGCFGVYGNASSCYGVYGSAPSRPVGGNGAYYNASSKYLKITEPICISNCLRKRPLKVEKYMWEDSNQTSFDQFIGPMAQDFDDTFRTQHENDGDEYSGLYTVDGVALGLGIENLNEIDKLKEIVIKLYSCIQKLENKGC